MQSEESDLIYSCNSNTVMSNPSADPISFDSSAKCIIDNSLFDSRIITSPSSVISYYPSDKSNTELCPQASLSFNDQASSPYSFIPNPSSNQQTASKPNATPKKKRRRQKSDSSESVSSMGSPDGSPRMLKKIGRVIQTTQSEKDLDTKVDYLVKNIMQQFLTKEKDSLQFNPNVKQEYLIQNEAEQVSPRKVKSKKRSVSQNLCEEHYISKVKGIGREKLGEDSVQFAETTEKCVTNPLSIPVSSDMFGLVANHSNSDILCEGNALLGVSETNGTPCRESHISSVTPSDHISSLSGYNLDVQHYGHLYQEIQKVSQTSPATCVSVDSQDLQKTTLGTGDGYEAAVQKYESFMNAQQKVSETKPMKKCETKWQHTGGPVGESIQSNNVHSLRTSDTNPAVNTKKKGEITSHERVKYLHSSAIPTCNLSIKQDEQRKTKQSGKLSNSSEKLSEYDLEKIAQLLKKTKHQYCTVFYTQLQEFSAGQNPEWLVNYPNIANLMGLNSVNDSEYDKAKQILEYMQAKKYSECDRSLGTDTVISATSHQEVSSSSMAAASCAQYSTSFSVNQHSTVGVRTPLHSNFAPTSSCSLVTVSKASHPSYSTVSPSSQSTNHNWKSPPKLNGAYDLATGDSGSFIQASVRQQGQNRGHLNNYRSYTSSDMITTDSKPKNFIFNTETSNTFIKKEVKEPSLSPGETNRKILEMNSQQPCQFKVPKTEEKNSWINSEVPGINLQTSPLVDRLKNNIKEEVPECNCITHNTYEDQRDGPYYTHLGAGPTVGAVRELMEKRLNMTGDAIRMEKVLYTGKEGKNPQGCPIAKWIIRRSGVQEKVLILVRPRRGHHCATSVIVIGICVWEGVVQSQADSMYDYLRNVLPKYGFETERRCGTNEKRTCACQGWDGDSSGASFTFGCSWSMYYNGCKFSKSTTPRKFKLKNQDEERSLENTLQTLATQLGPLYKKAAPESYNNMVEFEDQARDCRLGYEQGRPFSGVTAVVDFSAHSHKDQHNMNNGCTMVVTLTKHRGLSKPQDEQLHVLPLCVMDTTDETGNLDRQYEKIKNGSIEYLTKYPMKMRVRAIPLLSCKQRKKLNKNGYGTSGRGRGRGRGRKPVQNWITNSAKKVVWNTLYGGRGRGRGRATYGKKLVIGNSNVISKPPKVTSNVNKLPTTCKPPYTHSYHRVNRVFKSAEGYKYRVLPDGRRMKLKPGRPLQANSRHLHDMMANPYDLGNPYSMTHTSYGHNSPYGLHGDNYNQVYPNYHAPSLGQSSQYGHYGPARNPLNELSASQRGFYYNHIQWEQFYRRKECEDYFARFGVPHPYLTKAGNQIDKQPLRVAPSLCDTGLSDMSSYSGSRVRDHIPVPTQNQGVANRYHFNNKPYEHGLPPQNAYNAAVVPSPNDMKMASKFGQSQDLKSKEITFLPEHAVPPNKSVFDINQPLSTSENHFQTTNHQAVRVKEEHPSLSEADNRNLEPQSQCTHPHKQAANSCIHLDSSLPSFGRTFMTSQIRNPYEEQGQACESSSIRQHPNTSHYQVTSDINIAQDNVPKHSPKKQILSNSELSMSIRQQSLPPHQPANVNCVDHHSSIPSTASLEHSTSTSLNQPHHDNTKSQACEVEPQPTDPLDGAKEVYTECGENFMESNIGGVAIALTHGSVLFEVAKSELHATTAMKKPNRYEPTRISLVFYQHKNLNEEKHGYYEYLKKSEMWKQRRELKLTEQEKPSEASVKPQVLNNHSFGVQSNKEVEIGMLGECKKSSVFGGNESGSVFKADSVECVGEVASGERSSGEVSMRSKTMTTNSVHYTWLKPQLAVTGPYQRWY